MVHAHSVLRTGSIYAHCEETPLVVATSPYPCGKHCAVGHAFHPIFQVLWEGNMVWGWMYVLALHLFAHARL